MPPKKADAKLKKKEPEAPVAPSEFDALDTDSLKRILLELRADTDKVARERAQAQVDRDAVDRFFDITKKELRESELACVAKEREMELMAENHRVEVKVYQQKVKHLEYEHAHGMRKLAGEEDVMLKTDEDAHLRREAAMRAEKMAIKSRMREMEEANAEAVAAMKTAQEKNIMKLRQEFAANLDALRAKYELRMKHLRDDLRLRHKVEVHEVEERKNLHINQLMRAHEEAFAEMKRYYNDITKANLQLIAQLRAQIAEANDKVAANQRLMREIAEQNTRLKDPLEVCGSKGPDDVDCTLNMLLDGYPLRPCFFFPDAAASYERSCRASRGAQRRRERSTIFAIRERAIGGALRQLSGERSRETYCVFVLFVHTHSRSATSFAELRSIACLISLLQALRMQLATLEREHGALEAKYGEADRERGELYDKFDAMVRAARTRAEARNEALEKRLSEVEHEFIVKKTQVSEVMVAAKLDPAVVAIINSRLDAILESRNSLLRELQHSVATLTKAHNDAARVLAARLRDMGVTAAEVAYPLLPSATGLAPAGLVAKPGDVV